MATLTKTGLTFVNGTTPALNATNLNAIVDLTDDIVDYIQASEVSTETSDQASIVDLASTSKGNFKTLTASGQTRVNLLDDDVAGCESTTGWSTSSATVAIDSSNEFEGTNCLKMIATSTGGGIYRDILSLMDTSKYYLITGHLKDFDFTSGLRMYASCVGDAGTIATGFVTDTVYERVGVVVQPSDFDGASAVNLTFEYSGASTQYGFVGAITLQEITSVEYTAG